MPGTTRYSATFDRPYEEEDEPAEPPVTRRSRSQSLQINSANGRPYTPLGSFYGSHARSSSTDSGPRGADATERIPTRTAGNPTVKASHNPFQFVKVGTCSLYKKAAEQMKAQVKKQPEVLKEEEEDWQSNLDSWKTRRRKMSEDVFRRQEELRQLEIEEESLVEKKKTKTFSEMVEERAHRGRTLSLCLFSNPLEFDDWNFNKSTNRDKDEDNSNDSQHMSEGSEDNNNIISDDDDNDHHVSSDSKCTRDVNIAKKTRRIGIVHLPGSPNGVHNGVSINTKNYNGDFKESEHEISHDSISQKDESCISGMYIDSGLDSLSSSHRAGDIPDSGSDFSQDSGSSLDCDSPRVTGMMTTGMELLEEYSSKEAVQSSNGVIFQKEKPDGIELCLKLCLTGSKSKQYGFTISGGKDKSSPVTIASVVDGSVSELVGLKTGDQILALNSEDVSCLNHSTIVTALKQSVDTRHLELLLWRPLSNEPKDNISKNTPKVEVSMNEKCCAKSVASEVPSFDVKLPSLEEMPNNETIKTPDLVKISSSGQKISDDSVNNKKIASVKHKEVSRRKPAPPIPIKPKSNEEIRNLENTKTISTDEAISAVLEEKSVESENEMYVDDFSDVISKDSKQSHVMPEDSQKNTKNETEVHSIDNCMLTNNIDKGDGNAQEICNQRVPKLCSVPQDISLHIIYQSHPTTDIHKSQVEENQGCSSSVTASEEKDMSKMSAKVEQQAQEFVNIPAKISPTDNSTFAVGEVLPVDKVAEEMERMILQQLEQEEQLREKNKQILSASDHILSTADNLNQELVISDIDAPPRQLEPPKEKPPPPPPVSVNSEKDCGLKRVNSTKRIKKEMQKRRSDFLGIDNSEEEAIITDDDLACSSSSVETILKSECEQDRQQLSESEPLQKYPVAVDEDEIARKEREIIEHLETEERKRLENEKNKDEKELFVQAENFTAVQIEEERIKRLQEERKRMEEERFLREEQRVRMEEERQLREREEFVRKQEQASKIPGSDCVPSSDPNLYIDSEIKHLSHDKLLNCLNISNQSAETTSVAELLISPKPTSLLVKNQNQSISNEKDDPTISATKGNIAQENEILLSENITKSNVKQDNAKIIPEQGKLPKSSSSTVKKQNQNYKEKRDISEVYATKDIKTEQKDFLTDISTEANKKQNDIKITSKQTMLSVTTVKTENQNKSNKMDSSAVVTSKGNITKEVLLSVTNSKSDVKQDGISITSEQAEIQTPSSSTIKKQNQSNNKKKDISIVYGSKGKRAEKVLLTDTDTQPNNKQDDIKISEQTDVPKTSFTIIKTESKNKCSNEKDASEICNKKNNIAKEKEILPSDISSKSNEKEDDIKNTTKQAELAKSSKVKKQNQNYIKKDVCAVYASKGNTKEENILFTDASIQSNKKQDDIKVISEQAEVPKSSCTTVEAENQNNSNEKDTSVVMHTCKNNTTQENEVLLTDTRSKFNMKQNGINVISEQSEISKSSSSVEKQNQNKKKDVSVAYANKGNKTEKVFHMDKSTQPNKKQDDIKIISEQADVPKPSFVIIKTDSQNNNSNEKDASAICTGKSNITKEKEVLHSDTSSKSSEKLGNINNVTKQAELAKSSSSAVKKQNQNIIKKDVCAAVYASKSNKKEENVLLTDASTQLNKKQDDIKVISEQADAPKPSFTIIKTESQNNSSIKKNASAISAGKSNIAEENEILLSDTSTKFTEKQSNIKNTSKQAELPKSSSSKIKKQNQNNNRKDICTVNVSKSSRIDEKVLLTDAKTQSDKKQGDMKVIISEQCELPKSSCTIVEKENQNSSNKRDAPVIYTSKGNMTQVKEVNDTSSMCNVKQSDVKVMSEQTGLPKLSSSTVKKQNQNSNEKKDASVVCSNKDNRAENVLLTEKNTQSNEEQNDIKISEQAELPQLIYSVVKQHESNSNGKHLSVVCDSKGNIIQRNEVLLSETHSSNEKHAIRDEKVITDQAKLPNSSFLMHKEQNQNSNNKDVSAACASKSNIMVGKEVLLTASSSKSKGKQSDVKAVSELEKSTSSAIKKQNESNNNKKDVHLVCASQYNVTEEIFFPTDTHNKSKEKQSGIKAVSELQKSTSSTIKKQNTDNNNKNNVHPVGINEGNDVTEEIFFPTDIYSKSNETHVSSTLNVSSEQVGLPKSSISSAKNQNQNNGKKKDILADCAKICTSEGNKALLTDTNIQTTDKQDDVKVISEQSELPKLSSSLVKKQNQNNDKKDVITICAVSCNKAEKEILLTGTSSKSSEKQDLSNQKLSSQTELPKYVKKKNKHSKTVKQNSIESNSNKTLNNSDVSGNKCLSYSKPIITVEKEATIFAPLKYEQSITLCVNKISELPISSSNVLSSLSKSEAVHNLQNNHDNSSKLIITDCETVAKTSPAKSDAPKNLEAFNEQCCNDGTTLFSTPKSTNPKVNQFTHLSQIQQKHSKSDYGLETNAMESVRKIGVNVDVITKQSNASKTVENSKPHTGEEEITPQKIKQLPFSETTPEPKLLKSTEQISENFIVKSAGLSPSLQSTQNIPLGQSSKPLIDMKPSLDCASNKSQSNSLGSAVPLNSGSEVCIQNNIMNAKIMPNEATESATNSENTGGPKLVRVRKRIKKKENKPSELISSNSASSSPGTATNIPESAKISNLQHSNCMVNFEAKSAKSIKTDVINQFEDNKGNIPQVANCQKDEKLLESSSSVLSSSIATLNINTDKSLPVSSLSSSTSDNTSLSPSSDEKNKINKTSLIKPASNDDKIGGGNEEFGITVPQKPLKKKEVIRKERERLRQEQEALQREREEHRRQIQEQEQFKKNAQKPHAPDVPISRTGPPPPIKPALPTPLTSIPHVPQGIREDVAYTSRSLQGIAQNGQTGNPNIVGGTQVLVNNTAEVWLPSQVQLSSRQIQSIPPQTQSPSKQCQGVPPQIQSSSRQGQSVPSQTQLPNRQGQSVPPQTQLPNRQGQGSKNRPSMNEQWTHQKVAAVRKQADSSAESRYNQNHWLIQEAEMRRITEQKERQQLQISSEPRFPAPAQVQYHQAHPVSDSASGSHKAVQRATVMPAVSPVSPKQSNYSMLTQMHPSEQQWNYGQSVHPNTQNRKYPAPPVPSATSEKNHLPTGYSRNSRIDSTLQPPTKPSRVVPMERQEQMLSVSGRKRCSHCGEELGRGAAMIIESLQLFYHIQCFRCCVCQAQLGNGSCGTDVRVRNNKLHCHNCYSNDEAGLKFSQV